MTKLIAVALMHGRSCLLSPPHSLAYSGQYQGQQDLWSCLRMLQSPSAIKLFAACTCASPSADSVMEHPDQACFGWTSNLEQSVTQATGCCRTVEEDVPLLKQTLNSVLTDTGLQGAGAIDDLVAEICRFGAGELHCVAAIMGGIAAQEAIKLLTRQFVPLSGLLLYNAMASTSSVFKL